MAKRSDITAERARQLLDYDPETGILTWKARTPDMFQDGAKWAKETTCKVWNEVHAGKSAVRKSGRGGHATLVIDGASRAASIVVWTLYHGSPPERAVRFCSGDKMDIRIDNLRLAYSAEEVRANQIEASRRYLSNPENNIKHLAAVKRCRHRPHAKEKHRARQLDYSARNKEQERKRTQEWRLANPEKEAAGKRDYYLRNAGEIKAQSKAYRLANIDAYREYQANANARKRGASGRLSRGRRAELMILQGGRCVACKCDLTVSGSHIDHIVPIAKGGEHCDSNTQLLCPTCNQRKQTRSFEDFLRILEKERAENERTTVPTGPPAG